MAASTYKCPSCGGYLAFDPESQKWKCPFCDSIFDEQAVMENEEASHQPAAEGQQVMYRCQNCGSEIMTDETTVATHCYYCHSPVVLEGKLTSDMRPDAVLPFTVDKEKAVSAFMTWAKSKRYVPKAFFKEAQIESMTGVYYPHFVTDCEAEGSVEGEGRNISVSHTPNYVITKTDHYR
ncbi:MAG: TFIIB-type zinc ribbon-containing protein, partial [Clostridia bacterium]|nr:TFIIB-type zinc ribbon-containing protein [Clostridia bacterium]